MGLLIIRFQVYWGWILQDWGFYCLETETRVSARVAVIFHSLATHSTHSAVPVIYACLKFLSWIVFHQMFLRLCLVLEFLHTPRDFRLCAYLFKWWLMTISVSFSSCLLVCPYIYLSSVCYLPLCLSFLQIRTHTHNHTREGPVTTVVRYKRQSSCQSSHETFTQHERLFKPLPM